MDSRKMKRNVCTSRVVFRSAGVAFIVFGLVVAIFWPHIFDAILAGELTLRPNAKAFEQWKKPNVPLFLDVYFFNWTNSDDFLDMSTKPIVSERGPYRFREIRDKRNISFSNNSTVSYRTFSTFHFIEDESNGTLDDVITQLNIVAVGASAQALSAEYKKRKYISLGLNAYEQSLAVTKSVRELLFEGYEDLMVLMGREGSIEGFDLADNPYDRIGWFYLRNATDKLSGRYNVHTGKSDISKLGTIQNYNHLNYNKFYAGDCSKLYGSTGELFPPGQSRDKPVNLFTPDMCRSIPFDYEKDVIVHGLIGHRFAAGARAVDNGTKYPENSCFNGDEAVPSGVMNISACRYGSPVFMSFPHYFSGDEFYLNEVDGLNPQKSKHESYFTIEPLTGAPLEVTIRFQANLLVRPVDELSLFQDVPRVFMPAMWFEQKFVLDEKSAEEIRLAVQIPWFGRIAGFVVLGLGMIFVIISYLIACLFESDQSNQQQTNFSTSDGRTSEFGKKEVSPLINRRNLPKIVPATKRAPLATM